MNKKSSVPIITIDGPSASGKGTVALLVAKRLGWNFLDSGAMYRLIALTVKQKKLFHIDQDDEQSEQLLSNTKIDFKLNQEMDVVEAYLNDQLILDKQLRGEAISHLTSNLAKKPFIREMLNKKFKTFVKYPGLVTDGRDMGTVVFPNARVKLYLTADLEQRAKRRYQQICSAHHSVDFQTVYNELKKRDERDQMRDESPLYPANDALIIDNSFLNIQDLMDRVFEYIRLKNICF